MARLPVPQRDGLPPEGQQAWDAIAASRGNVVGPFLVLVHLPEVAERVAALGETLRFRGTLPDADRELAILTAGREGEALFEWAAHEPMARRAGVREEAIATVRDRLPVAGLTPREALIVEVVRGLVRDHRLRDELYARAEAEFGRQTLIELVTLAGYYTMIGFVLNAFEVDLPAGATPAFGRG
jgi:4-carboxymuconolactone decarboxylase